jgi:hypothetical protein
MRRGGGTLTFSRENGVPDPKLVERVKARCTVDEETGCWVWWGAMSDELRGYPSIWVDGRSRPVHRLMYVYEVGTIRPGREIHHLCRNRRCVNPDHLIQVSRGGHDSLHPENRDAFRAATEVRRKLSVKKARRLRRRWLQGETMAALAREHNLSLGATWAICHGKSYR